MNIFEEMFGGLTSILGEVFGFLAENLPRALHLVLWAVCGVLIFPFVYIAGVLYPKWSEWGEKM